MNSKKEKVNGEIVRVRKGLQRTNKPVELPENPTWLKQPNLITLMSHDFRTIQIRVLIALVERIQGSIEESIQGIKFEQMSLFKEFDNPSKIILPIMFKDLGIGADQYKDVKTALRQLATIPVELDTIDPVTGADSWSVTGLFKAYIPKTAYNKQFTIEMDKNIAKAFVNVDKGFTRFIKEIAFNTQSKYTVRMYLLISSWKDKGGFSITIEKFRKWLKIENKYAKYKDLYKRIIRPVYEELFEKANCWFEVAEVYREGESEPYKLNFKVIKSALSKKEQDQLESYKRTVTQLCSQHFRMQDKHIKLILPHLHLGNYQLVTEKILWLGGYVKDNFKTIGNIPEYCVKALLNVLETPDGVVGDHFNEEEQ